ncbi:restriction endonuclease subunit S [Algiphilus sp.]|uniref:restriction endonuclease subunit S n=1 Tax=Algiphilus sp. TaxID=1872431 RepID=UPI0032EDCD61
MSAVAPLYKWTTRPLDELFEIVGGGTPSKKEPKYWGGDIPWASIRDMHSAELSSTEFAITESGLQNSSTRIIPAGEVIMASRVGLGKACVLMQDTAINQDIRALIPRRPDRIERRFCLYWLQSIADVIADAGSGATVKGVKLPFIKSLSFPDIELEEQKRIVAVLDQAFAALDRACAHAEANLANSQALYKAILEEIFAERAKWPREDLSKRVRFLDYRGKTPPKSDRGVPLITAKNVRMGFIKTEPAEFVEEGAYEEWMKRGFPEEGDVLFTTEAPLANVAQLTIDGKVVIGQRLITMQTDHSEIDPCFLKWSLLSPQMQNDIHSQATGATVLGIKAKLLKKITLHVPASLEKQREIGFSCETAFAKKNELEQQYMRKLESLLALRQKILHGAFAGELT